MNPNNNDADSGASHSNAVLDGLSSCCAECGMPGVAGEYHPYAACLMFKGCHNGSIVRANLDSVVAHGYQMAVDAEAANAELRGAKDELK